MKALLSVALLCAILVSSASSSTAQRAVVAPGQVRLSAPRYQHAPRLVWVPGHHELRSEEVWVPERCERVWVEARHELRLDACGLHVRVELEPAHWKTIHHPAHGETRSVRVWVPGHHEPRARCD